jgi:hypothetical protein
MSVTSSVQQTSVPASYRHHQRVVTAGSVVPVGNALLKWYEIVRPHVAITDALREQTRAFLAAASADGRLQLDADLGFVMLHIGDSKGVPDSVALLLVTSWRSANELWESVYFKPSAGDDAYEPVPKSPHQATFCVWELPVVWHERNAWTRYLESARDDAAREAYLADRFAGVV